MFSANKFLGKTGGHSLGGACDHNKVHGLSLFPHQRNSILRFIGFICLRYARENTEERERTIKGGEQVAKVGGGGGGAQKFDCVLGQLLGCRHMPTVHLGGIWGHAPPENFGNFDSLRAFLMQSGTSFWTDFSSNFYFSTLCKQLEL